MRLILHSLDCGLAFESDCPEAHAFLRSPVMTTLIPAYTWADQSDDQLFTIRYYNQDQPGLLYQQHHIAELYGSWGNSLASSELGRFISIHFEPLYHTVCSYPFHACVTEYNGRALALLGERGAGKTSTGIALCQQYGFRFICNSRAMIKTFSLDTPCIIDGIQLITVRADLLRFVPGLSRHIAEMSSPWSRHMIGDGSSANIPMYHDLPVPLRAFLLLRLNPAVQEVRRLDKDEAISELYERSSQMIRVGAVIQQGNVAIPSLDTHRLATQRLTFIRNLVKHIPLFQVMGSMDFICHVAHRIMENEDAYQEMEKA